MRTALLLASLLQAAPAGAPQSPADHAGWWIEHYGVVDAGDDARVRRAGGVFERVAAAADKNGKRFPSLVVLQRKAGLFATALPDGTVLLTPDGLELCYAGVAAPTGDARLAFVLGHELSHLARDDFWHGFAAAATPQAAETPEAQHGRELQADSYGLLFMSVAGYPASAVVSSGGSFLEDWARRARSGGAAGSHPAAPDRSERLRQQLLAVEERLDLYRTGVRLQQLGRPLDALLFLEAFQAELPSREVFGAIGLSHFELALRAFAACDPAGARRYRLPTVADPEPRGGRATLRGAGDECRESAAFRRWSHEAVRHLEHATQLDATYAPARVNLASALLLAGQPARALAAAESALESAPRSVEARIAKALALHLYGADSGIETAGFALDLLQALQREQPDDPTTAYNIAALLDARQRPAAARVAWEAFLGLEPAGPWAAAARQRLGLAPPARSPGPTLAPPVALGPVTRASEAQLRGLRRRAFDLGGVSAAVYEGGTLRIVTLDESVEIVEERLGRPVALEAMRAGLGSALREQRTPAGLLVVYSRLALDVREAHVVGRVFFVE